MIIRKKNILILGLGSTQGLGEHSLSAEKMYLINFTKANTKFCLSLHYNGANSYLFFNGTETYKFNAKDSEIVPNNLSLGNVSKDFSTSNMKKAGFNGHIFDFNVDYDAIAVEDILDIHNYLMKKNDIFGLFGFIEKHFFTAMMFFGCNLSTVNPLNCNSINNQELKVKPEIVNANSEEPVFFPFSIKTSKCRLSCDNINDPYAKLCVSDVVKNLIVRVFNLMSKTNETRHIEWHETCKCKCRLDASVCNNKQR